MQSDILVFCELLSGGNKHKWYTSENFCHRPKLQPARAQKCPQNMVDTLHVQLQSSQSHVSSYRLNASPHFISYKRAHYSAIYQKQLNHNASAHHELACRVKHKCQFLMTDLLRFLCLVESWYCCSDKPWISGNLLKDRNRPPPNWTWRGGKL